VDPVKEVEASRKAIDYGLSTLAEEAAGQGRDWEEVLEQQRREQDKAEELDIEVYHAGGAAKQAESLREADQGGSNAETEEK